jgi:alkylhydroperoxidase family enzyme
VSEEDVACLSPDDPRFTPREAAALRFAELFAADHLAIGDHVLADLGRHFSAAEVVELGMFAALMLGSGRLTRVLRAYEDDDRAPVLDR